MKIGTSHTTTCIYHLPEFSQIGKKSEKRLDAVLAKYGMTYYPSTSEVIAPIDTELEYGDMDEIIEEIREAIAGE